MGGRTGRRTTLRAQLPSVICWMLFWGENESVAFSQRYKVPGRSVVVRAVLPVCVALIAAAVPGCSATGPLDAPPCFPPAYSLRPQTAKVGQTVTVAAPDADCNPRYGTNARIHVTMTDAAGSKVFDDTAPMNDAGGFTFAFDVPPGSSAGAASVTAQPYNLDWCDDTGRNNRVAESLPTSGLDRVSCALPVQILMITP